MLKEPKRAPKLPAQQLFVLAICRFAEPVAMTSVFPYLPEMIQSFNVPTDQVAKWAGLTSAVFSLSQAMTGIAWGRASDKMGRKPVILIALTCTMLSSLLFGFSTTLVWAFIARSLQGLSNGNVGIIRTVVAEIVPEKELQPRAFSVMPLIWTIGSIFGPAFGGALVYPVKRLPSLFGHVKFLERYPFALPNLCISLFFLTGILCGFLFLRESLEDKKDRKDYGLILGSLLTTSCSKRPRRPKNNLWRIDTADEADPFLPDSSPSTELSRTPTKTTTQPLPPPPKPPGSWSGVFTRQSNINLGVYTLLAMHSVAYDQLVPVFMHHPVQSPKNNPDVHLPFKFAGGFGMASNRIGALFMAYGVFGMFVQFALFPPMARRFGVLNCLKGCALTFPGIYIATPFTALLPSDALREGVMVALMLCKGWCAIFAFPCSTILLTNSASSLKILGTLNGVATSISAVGRAAGPALAGWVFTVGVDRGSVAFSWWFLACVALAAAVPVFFLVEMEGFGSSGGEDSEDISSEEDEDDEHDKQYARAEDIGETSATPSSSALRKTSTSSMTPYSLPSEVVEDPEIIPEDMPFLMTSTSWASTTQNQYLTSSSRRGSMNLLRRVPSPIGLGPRGVRPDGARRYSSDMGYTRSGFGAGGTSYH